MPARPKLYHIAHVDRLLVERTGVQSRATYTAAVNALPARGHRPPVEIRPEWYY